jgi:ubiquinone/menaquinone biosynthesis C-methylase UbiE
MNSQNARIHEQASIGFQRAADAYERGRPEYPAAAVERLVRALKIAAGSRVVELGAGTGKFTKALLATGAEIIAVEPVEAMRRKLAERLPSLPVVDGTAEAIPLPDASVDAVVAAQAFHWFRGEEALAEIHRVLKPGGGLGLIWNARDESLGWVRGLTEIIEPYEGSAPRYKSFQWKSAFESTGLFSPLEKAEFVHIQTIPAEAIEDRIASISFIAALPDSTRATVLEQVRELVRADPAVRGLKEVEFPYRTDVYWCRAIE